MTESDNGPVNVVETYKQELASACELVLADEIPPEGVDVLFFHGRAPGDEGNLFPFMKELYDQGLVKQILIPGTDGQSYVPNTSPEDQYEKGEGKYTANPGKAEWAKMLDEVGFDLQGAGGELTGKVTIYDGDVKNTYPFQGEIGELTGVVATTSPGVRTTKEENEAVLKYALEHGIKSIALLAHPHQLPRAMLGMVATLNAHNITDIKVYAVHSDSTDWDKIVPGSQGKNLKQRRLHAIDETIRIPTYQNNSKKDDASFEELQKYYELRDRGPQRMQELLKEKQNDPNFQMDVQVMKEAIQSLPSERLSQLLAT